MGPTLKKNKKIKKIKIKSLVRRTAKRETERKRDIFFIFSFLASLFDIWKSNRRISSGQEEKCSTRRGLCMGTKNTRFRRVFN